jgi:hypothetical protein
MPLTDAGATNQSHSYKGKNPSTTSGPVPAGNNHNTFSVWQVNDGSGGGPDD